MRATSYFGNRRDNIPLRLRLNSQHLTLSGKVLLLNAARNILRSSSDIPSKKLGSLTFSTRSVGFPHPRSSIAIVAVMVTHETLSDLHDISQRGQRKVCQVSCPQRDRAEISDLQRWHLRLARWLEFAAVRSGFAAQRPASASTRPAPAAGPSLQPIHLKTQPRLNS